MSENPRPIRSFVRRQGRMTPGQKQALEKLWPSYGLELEGEYFDFEKLFKRKAPTIVEIGFGMGEVLLQLAEEHPENNYIGIDVHEPGIGAVLMGLEKGQLDNVRLIKADALDVFNKAIPNESLAGVHLFFPDPWPKKRHHKRRIVNENFAALIREKLKLEGYIHMATDWENYAQQMLEVMSNTPGFINAAGSKHFIPTPATRPKTRFEQRGERLGHGVWDLLFIRCEV